MKRKITVVGEINHPSRPLKELDYVLGILSNELSKWGFIKEREAEIPMPLCVRVKHADSWLECMIEEGEK